MADTTRTVGIDIKITTSDSRKEVARLAEQNNKLKDLLNDTTKTGQTGFNNLGSSIGKSGISTSLNGIALAAAAAYAGFKLLGELKDVFVASIKESVQQQDALDRLSQALRATGSFSEQAVANFNDFASALERTSRFEGDNILQNLALAKAMGASNEQAKNLVNAAAQLSAQFGGSLDDNTEKLAKTLNGTTGKLGQTVGALKQFSEEQLKAGAAVDYINKQFAGSSAAGLENYSGKLNTLGDSYKNFLQSVGDLITKSPLTLKVLEQTALIFDRMTLAMTSTDNAYKGVAKSSGEYEAAIEKEKLKLIELNEKLEELQKTRDNLTQNPPNGFDVFLGNSLGYTVTTAQSAAEEIKKVEASIKASNDAIIDLSTNKALIPDDPNKDKKGNAGVVDTSVLDARQQLYIQMADLQNQAAVESANQEAELRLIQEQGDYDYREQQLAAELEYQLNKNQIIYSNELAKNELIKNAQNKALADQKAAMVKEQADKKAMGEWEKKANLDLLSAKKNTMNLFVSLANSKNKELAGIGKAAGVLQIAQATPVAVAEAFKWGTSMGGPVLGAVFGGIAGVAMAAQAAQLAGIQFADGGEVSRINGRVGGASMRGDTTSILVNGDETVLNHKERRVISDLIADGGGMGGGMALEVLQSINNKIGMAPAIYIDGTLITKELNRFNNLSLGA